jgi:transaldolase
MSSLEQLKSTGTVVVCDSGDFATIDKYKPQDATTNPSLILAASKKPEYASLIDAAVAKGKTQGKTVDEQVDATLDNLLVEFGKKILEIIPGKVSTEVDARFSFDTKASVDKALHIIKVRERFTSDPFSPLLTSNSSTKRPASPRTASSSKSPPPGRVSRPLTSCSPSTASTAT